MIVFDLDGTLADCEHRRHFIEHNKNEDLSWEFESVDNHGIPLNGTEHKGNWFHPNDLTNPWKPDWKAFYEACDQDKPIYNVMQMARCFMRHEESNVQIWSGRSEEVYQKTIDWLFANQMKGFTCLKMRPIGDYTPDDQLKERWLDEALAKGEKIQFVVDDRPKVIRMWRRRGIFVFDVNQSGEEF